MKKILGTFLLCALCFSSAFELAAKEIKWQNNYTQALSDAGKSNKPLVVFFTGSDWCIWCKKLEQEALSTKEFADKVGDKFIFVSLDFPKKPKIDNDSRANKALMDKFGVKGFPGVVIVNSKGEKIAKTGYQPGGGASFAEHLEMLATEGAAPAVKTNAKAPALQRS